MNSTELFFICLGAAVVIFYGVKALLFTKMLRPTFWFPLPQTFFTSMGEWAVVTGASDGIGREYAFALAERGMNVVIMSRTKEKLNQVAGDIEASTGRRVQVIVADFVKDSIFKEFQVNNVGTLPSLIPCKFLQSADLDQAITRVINCNVKTMVKMCSIVLPGMNSRGRGVIVNVSSGVATFPSPLYSLYAASKVFVERFSQGLQAEYKDKGIIIQAVAPFGVCTQMASYLEPSMVALSPKDFVKCSLQYIRAGDKTYGSISHIVLGGLLQLIPLSILQSELIQHGLQDFLKKKATRKGYRLTSTSEFNYLGTE
ncbi:17-beta-hydroxysteroid dehydrogenase type 3 isoform X2 [Synchiropus splendidus]|uniref:17-beta-hydroxysteroid dehydrogenase type 3 isoform X2 n=1 Tax=Synchiropus splendidus TaxID=270530 RepID=UPI00237DD47E|nr:17-beta-hydroxysteroid dehydrogenase type 3 isoform X2 [Synchiropus splendidus]